MKDSLSRLEKMLEDEVLMSNIDKLISGHRVEADLDIKDHEIVFKGKRLSVEGTLKIRSIDDKG